MTAKQDAKRFFNNLKQHAQDNPLLAIGIAAMFMTATSKLMDANTQRVYAKAHVKEVDRRIAMQINRSR